MARGVKLTSSTPAHHTTSLVNFIPDKFNLKWEIESLKHRNDGHQKTDLRLTPQPDSCTTLYGAHTYKYLVNWGNYTKGELNLKWPNLHSSDIPKLLYLCAQLEKAGHKINQTEWKAYIGWYLEASKRGNDRVTF